MPSKALNITNSLKNYGIQFQGFTLDPVFTKGFLNSRPNFFISGNSCFIDYTEVFNISDRVCLKKLFKNTPVGTTFYINPVEYYDENLDYRDTFSGIISFEQLKSDDKLIIAGISSGFTHGNTYTYFLKENFLKPFQYITGYTGNTLSNYIENNLSEKPNKTFYEIGVIGSVFNQEEYLEILGSTYNLGKLKVNSSIVLNDGKELIYFDVGITSENLKTDEVIINQYLRGDSNPTIISKNKKTKGCYLILDDNGEITDCFEQQNEIQAFLRNQFKGSTQYTNWAACQYCERITTSSFDSSDSNKSFVFDALIFLSIRESVSSNGEVIYYVTGNYPSLYSGTPFGTLFLNIPNALKIDLSHPSLSGYSINIYSDLNKNLPATNNIFYIGSPGADQASIYIVNDNNTSKFLYFELLGPQNLSFNITLT